MEKKYYIIYASVLFIILAVQLDWDLFLFDRTAYLEQQLGNKCADADITKGNYRSCKTQGYKDERCEYFQASYIKKEGECYAAESALEAYLYKQKIK